MCLPTDHVHAGFARKACSPAHPRPPLQRRLQMSGDRPQQSLPSNIRSHRPRTIRGVVVWATHPLPDARKGKRQSETNSCDSRNSRRMDQMPTRRSFEIRDEALGFSGPFQIRVIPGGGHQMTVGEGFLSHAMTLLARRSDPRWVAADRHLVSVGGRVPAARVSDPCRVSSSANA